MKTLNAVKLYFRALGIPMSGISYWNGKCDTEFEKRLKSLTEKVPESGRAKSVNMELVRIIMNFYYEIYNNGCMNMFDCKTMTTEISCDEVDCDEDCPVCGGLGYYEDEENEFFLEDSYKQEFNFLREKFSEYKEFDKVIDMLEDFCLIKVECGHFNKETDGIADLMIDAVIWYCGNHRNVERI